MQIPYAKQAILHQDSRSVNVRGVIGKCPICGEDLIVTQLHCPSCDTTINGQLALGRFYQLSPEQLRFVETFIRCEGKLTRVQDEMGISYPTVRSRLGDVIRTLGYEVEETLTPDERKTILADLAQGKMTSEEAIRLLKGA